MSADVNPLTEDVALEEGVADIGLPLAAVEQINLMFNNTPEKGKTVVGNILKNASLYTQVAAFNTKSQGAYKEGIREIPADLLAYLFEAIDLNRVSRLPEEEQQKISNELAQIQRTARDMLGTTADQTLHADRVTFKTITKFKKWLKKSMSPNGYLSKLAGKDLDQSRLQDLIDKMDNALETIIEEFAWHYNQALAPFLNMHPDNYKKIDVSGSLREANQLAKEEIEKIENEDLVLNKFDDGSYWYNLNTTHCSIEADRMGHCGADSRATTLYSLRKKESKQKESKSFVTIAYNADESLITQIKGRFNELPPESTWPHIAWFIDNFDVQTVEETGEEAADVAGFGEMIDYLKENTTSGTDFGGLEKKIEEMTEALTEIRDTYDRRMVHSYTDFEVEDPYELEGRISYTYWGKLGIPIRKSVLSEEQEAKITGKIANWITSEMTEYFPFINDNDQLEIKDEQIEFIFYFSFNASDGYSDSAMGYGDDPDDYANFCSNLEDQDDNAGAIAAHLMNFLALYEIIEGGKFVELISNYENGEYDDSTGFTISYDEDYDTGLPETLTFEFGEKGEDVEVDLSSLKGKVPDYFLEPENVMQILGSRDYKLLVRSELVNQAGMNVGEVPLPSSYHFGVKQKSPSVYTIEAGYTISSDDGDKLAEVIHTILTQGWTEEELSQIAFDAYVTMIQEINEKDMEKQQKLDLSEAVLNKWKLMIR